MGSVSKTVYAFFAENTPPLKTILLGGPVFLTWAVSYLAIAGWLERNFQWCTGYMRKLFHILIFGTTALLEWKWGAPMVFRFGEITTLMIGYAIFRGPGNVMYEAMAREIDEPHRTYFIVGLTLQHSSEVFPATWPLGRPHLPAIWLLVWRCGRRARRRSIWQVPLSRAIHKRRE